MDDATVLCGRFPCGESISDNQFFENFCIIVLTQILPGHKENQKHQHKMDARGKAGLRDELPDVKQCQTQPHDYTGN